MKRCFWHGIMVRSMAPLVAALLITCTLCSPAGAQATRPARPNAQAPRGAAGAAALERLREVIDELKPTEEQRAQLNEIVDRAVNEAREIMREGRDLSQEVRLQRWQDFLGDVREQVGAVLDEQQRAMLRERMRQPGGAGRAGAARDGLMQRLDGALAKLELTTEQRAKVDALVAETREKIKALREQARANAEKAGEQVREIRQDVMSRLEQILSAEQQQKLRELMRPAGAAERANRAGPSTDPAERRARNRTNRGPAPDGRNGNRSAEDPARAGGAQPPATSPAEPSVPAPPATQPSGSQRSSRGVSNDPSGTQVAGKAAAATAATTTAADPAAPVTGPPEIGKPAPELHATKLDGTPVRLSSFKGRLVLLVFGSHSSPSFRQRALPLEQLRRDLGGRVDMLLVYTREAHPAGEWEVERNRDDNLKVESHKNIDARLSAAKAARDSLKIQVRMAVDDMTDATAAAYAATPNNAAALVGRDGQLLYYQRWFEPSGIKLAAERALQQDRRT